MNTEDTYLVNVIDELNVIACRLNDLISVSEDKSVSAELVLINFSLGGVASQIEAATQPMRHNKLELIQSG